MEKLEAVEHPLIPLIRIPRFGLVIEAAKLIEQEERIVVKRRMRIERLAAKGKPAYTCAGCNAPVYLRASVLRRWYFRHEENWPEPCPYQGTGERHISDIDAYRYNGQKEGWLHRTMKRLVKESLEADSRFTNLCEERWWIGTNNPNTRRRPDLRADYLGLRIAFEMQPSATYISVINARREFFLAEGGLLFWIFPWLQSDLLRLYQADVFFNNNCNIFVVDEETVNQSRRSGKFTLRCHYWRPRLLDGQIKDEPESQLVPIDELRTVQKKQEVYYFDYRGERAKVERTPAQPQDELLKKRFIDFWLEHGATHTEEAQEKYKPLRRLLSGQRVPVPVRYTEMPFNATVKLILSAQLKQPVGFGHTKLIQVAHWVYDFHKPLLLVFGWICKERGGDRIIAAEDRSGKWSARIEQFRFAWTERDPTFAPAGEIDPIADYLEPGIAERLRAARERWDTAEEGGG